MKFRIICLIAVFGFVFAVPTFAQRTATNYLLNPTVVGNQFSFEVWSQRTNVSGSALVGISSFVFDVDQTGAFDFNIAPVLSSVNSKYTGADGNAEDYGPMTAIWSTVASVKKVNISVNFTGNNVGAGAALVTTAPNGEMVCKVTLTITNAAKTANLTWDQVNSSLTTSNSQPLTNSYSGSSNIVLPVELTSFNATAKGRNVELTWKTATETNNSGFDVERSVAGVSDWTKVSFVEGNGTSNSAHSYSFTDAVKAAGKYSYRLKQIDRNGKFEYSQAVEAVTSLSASDYALSANYPNPFNPSTKFNFAVKNNQTVSVKVFNAIGQEVATLFNGLATADNIYEMSFDASGLSSGTYFYMLRTNDRYEVKKMLLMK